MNPTNPRYRLYCLAHGFDPDETKPKIVRDRTRRFPRWLARQRQAFKDATGSDALDNPTVFDFWLEAQVDA